MANEAISKIVECENKASELKEKTGDMIKMKIAAANAEGQILISDAKEKAAAVVRSYKEQAEKANENSLDSKRSSLRIDSGLLEKEAENRMDDAVDYITAKVIEKWQ